jgi:antitoxin MazE
MIDPTYCVITVVTMKTKVNLAKIGNSQGIRLSKKLLESYRITDCVEIETTPDAIIIRPIGQNKLTWAETYQQIAQSNEDWSEWDAVAEDGIEYED